MSRWKTLFPFVPHLTLSFYNLGTVQVQINILKDLRLFTQQLYYGSLFDNFGLLNKPTFKLDRLHSSSSTHRYCGQEAAF